ncbi:MAG: CocE/NonD family hydrolase C-terminal non-catalytic domain-containing protein, partial [Gemmatimonadota bacterium]
TKAVWMEKDKVYRLEVSLKATAFSFAAGHRIRLWISSSDFPLHDRNLNTGGDNVTETTWVKATNTVHQGGQVASYLSLPIAAER